jgi:hypothetical protein
VTPPLAKELHQFALIAGNGAHQKRFFWIKNIFQDLLQKRFHVTTAIQNSIST